MMQHIVDDSLRSVNLVLALVTFVWLIVRRIRHPKWYANSNLRNDIWFMAVFWSLALIVGSFELVWDTGTSTRVAFSMLAVLITLRILFRPVKDWDDVMQNRSNKGR